MSIARRFLAAAAIAGLATVGVGSVASASVSQGPADRAGYGHHQMHWYWVDDDGGLVNINDNNVGPFQVCNNNVPVNVVGGQAAVSDVVGLLGIDSNGNTATLIKSCDQQNAQANHNRGSDPSTHWYRYNGHGGLVSVSDNNVGPVQACNNNVPVNVVGIQVPIEGVTGLLGIDSNGNSATLVKSCSQSSSQNN